MPLFACEDEAPDIMDTTLLPPTACWLETLDIIVLTLPPPLLLLATGVLAAAGALPAGP